MANLGESALGLRFEIAILVLGTLCSCVYAAGDEFGVCDPTAPREQRTLQFNAESGSDTASPFVIQLPCTDEKAYIKRCAVITVRHERTQHFCFRADRPAYYEYLDTVEYWDNPTSKEPAH
jgi:hypothetical protein